MPEINRQTNTSNMIWQLIDKETGAENAGITWTFRVGDRIKIRLANEMDQDHPMITRSIFMAPHGFLCSLVTASPKGIRRERHGPPARGSDDRHPS